MTAKLTNQDYVNRARKVHGDTYCYGHVNYRGYFEQIEIVCYDHGAFWQGAHTHLAGSGCKECGKEARVFNRWLTELIELQDHCGYCRSILRMEYGKHGKVNAKCCPVLC